MRIFDRLCAVANRTKGHIMQVIACGEVLMLQEGVAAYAKQLFRAHGIEAGVCTCAGSSVFQTKIPPLYKVIIELSSSCQATDY